MRKVISELKIMGINPLLISSALVLVFALFAVLGGELLSLSNIGYEIIFPLFIAIGVCEWGKIKADENYDLIAAQIRSVFSWVFIRFFTVFCVLSLFTISSMVITCFVRGEMPMWEMILTYISPAFFLSTLAVLFNLFFPQEHISTLICGTFWLVTILARSLLRIPGIEYLYLFIRFADAKNSNWMINKVFVIIISCVIWILIFFICENKLKVHKIYTRNHLTI